MIINGDDYGMNKRCTQAIAQAIAQGLLTHTSMMANGEYFDEAVLLAKDQGFEDLIGIHFNITEGEPLTTAMRGSDAFCRGGLFHRDYWRRPRALSAEERQAVYEELTAQVLKLRQAGLTVSHADSHHYVHTYKAIAPIAAAVCREQGIKRIRLNRDFDTPQRPMITADRVDNGYWREQGFVTTAHFGRLSDAETFDIPEDTEILVHPDFDKNGALIDRTGTRDGCPVGDRFDKRFF